MGDSQSPKPHNTVYIVWWLLFYFIKKSKFVKKKEFLKKNLNRKDNKISDWVRVALIRKTTVDIRKVRGFMTLSGFSRILSRPPPVAEPLFAGFYFGEVRPKAEPSQNKTLQKVAKPPETVEPAQINAKNKPWKCIK